VVVSVNGAMGLEGRDDCVGNIFEDRTTDELKSYAVMHMEYGMLPRIWLREMALGIGHGRQRNHACLM
jgi:hypothetical protein